MMKSFQEYSLDVINTLYKHQWVDWMIVAPSRDTVRHLIRNIDEHESLLFRELRSFLAIQNPESVHTFLEKCDNYLRGVEKAVNCVRTNGIMVGEFEPKHAQGAAMLAATSVDDITFKFDRNKQSLKKKSLVVCTGCGRQGHQTIECRLVKHKDFNRSNRPFHETEQGKIYAAAGQPHLLKWKEIHEGGVREVLNTQPSETAWRQEKGSHAHMMNNLFNNSLPLISMRLQLRNKESPSPEVDVLLDSGASGGSFICTEIATSLLNAGVAAVWKEGRRKICGGLGGVCEIIERYFVCDLVFSHSNKPIVIKDINFLS